MAEPLTLDEFQERLDRIGREFPGDMNEALALCTFEVWKGIGSNFDRQATAGGEAWPPRKDKLTHPLLRLTGALEEAATGQGANSFSRVENGDTLEIGVTKGASGTSLGGAAVHQYGYPEKNIAQREYLGFTDEALDACVEILADAAVANILEVLA